MISVVDNKLSSIVDRFVEYDKNAVGFVEDVLGARLYLWQGDVLEALSNLASPRIVIRSRPEVGKTTVAAFGILWWLLFHPYCKIPCTAPTEHQLDDLLWPEIAKWIRLSNLSWLYNHRASKLSLNNEFVTKEWYAVPVVGNGRLGHGTNVALQGFHSAGVFFVVDEASGLDDESWSAIDNTFTRPESSDASLLAVGNPTFDTNTRFYSIFDRLRKHYWTYHVTRDHEPKASESFKEQISDTYGKDSAMWIVKVDGNFPPPGSSKALVTGSDIDMAKSVKMELIGSVTLSVDPAWFGDDTSAFALCQNNCILRLFETSKESTMETVGRIISIVNEYYTKDDKQLKLSEIRIDVIGYGAGVYDRLVELQESSGKECVFLKKVDIIPVDVATSSSGEQYLLGKPYKLRDELWINAAQLFKTNRVGLSLISDIDGVKQEYVTVGYKFMSDGTVKVNSKEEIKRMGRGSPNRADAINIALASRAILGYPEIHIRTV